MREALSTTNDSTLRLWAALEGYVRGESSLAEAEQRLADLLAEDEPLDEMTAAFTLALAEFTSGHATEDELREEVAVALPAA